MRNNPNTTSLALSLSTVHFHAIKFLYFGVSESKLKYRWGISGEWAFVL
jgi:hypothetical protein